MTAVSERTGLLPVLPTETTQLTDGQRRALHAKAGELGRLRGQTKTAIVTAALAAASRRFARPLVSVNDLSRGEASAVLDSLEEELAAVIVAGGS